VGRGSLGFWREGERIETKIKNAHTNTSKKRIPTPPSNKYISIGPSFLVKKEEILFFFDEEARADEFAAEAVEEGTEEAEETAAAEAGAGVGTEAIEEAAGRASEEGEAWRGG